MEELDTFSARQLLSFLFVIFIHNHCFRLFFSSINLATPSTGSNPSHQVQSYGQTEIRSNRVFDDTEIGEVLLDRLHIPFTHATDEKGLILYDS